MTSLHLFYRKGYSKLGTSLSRLFKAAPLSLHWWLVSFESVIVFAYLEQKRAYDSVNPTNSKFLDEEEILSERGASRKLHYHAGGGFTFLKSWN